MTESRFESRHYECDYLHGPLSKAKSVADEVEDQTVTSKETLTEVGVIDFEESSVANGIRLFLKYDDPNAIPRP